MMSWPLLAAVLAAAPAPAAEWRVRHTLTVGVDPTAHRLSVSDQILLPAGKPAEFLLNANLLIRRATPEVEEIPVGDVSFFGINAGAEIPKAVELKRYRARTAPPGGVLALEYQGPFDFGLADAREEYTRGFRETAGILGPQGVYLAGSGFWYPHLGPELIEFQLTAAAPPGWHLISQGNGSSRDAEGVARWDSAGATDEIYLVGGPLHEYRESAGAVEVLAYLRDRDDGLAARYLAATAQYLEMYRALIGPYPYRKFALVENFWETGYGMPSFTLLGPQIIRFPFILTSSYPHEILHNWWGNSVFVDYESGNWCEGLTAYLADHLIQEQRGKGHQHRQAALQKYRDYVKEGRDFPLSEFRSRHSAATEAVGYGKTMMGFHVLRRLMGDQAFRQMLARFYREQRGRRASFADIRKAAEAVSGKDLGRFFGDWIARPGAPALAVSVSRVRRAADGFEITGLLEQTQGGAPFALEVPVVVQTAKDPVARSLRTDAARAPFTLTVPDQPLVLHLDPYFDVFRRLDPRETAPSIGQIFGEPRILAVLASAAPDQETRAYRALVEGWGSDSHAIEVRLDSQIRALPPDRSVWLLGRANRLAPQTFPAGGPVRLEAAELSVQGEQMPLAKHSVVLTARHPGNLEKAVGWIFADPQAALAGLGRKLPHYGKYSYLGFEGEEPVNVIKGQWVQTDSPLRVDLRPEGARATPVEPLPMEPRQALAELPPVFSEKALREHVAYLASPELAGRGLGSPGLEAAAAYIADRFKALGLAAGGDGGTYLQRFAVAKGEDGQPHQVANVVGYLPGTKAEWKDQSVILSAHYDHLGLGWPDVHKGDEGRVHPGADDNASGVAVMLELARVFASGEKPQRSIAFIAFAGEEAGLLGSKHFVEHETPLPIEQVRGVINLDTVGRLGSQKLSVLGTGTASEWPHIFRGASFVTGVESTTIAEPIQASDQMSFVARGIPAVQVFTGAHPDYHRPGDTADKIDAPGLVRVATFVKEGVAYLAERPDPLTVTIAKSAPPAPTPPGGQAPGRRVSFGTVPDFAFAGPGVRASGVVPGSPAEKAGIKEGDVILKLDGQGVANVQAFSDLLKTLTPGQTIAVVVQREGKEETVQVTVVER